MGRSVYNDKQSACKKIHYECFKTKMKFISNNYSSSLHVISINTSLKIHFNSTLNVIPSTFISRIIYTFKLLNPISSSLSTDSKFDSPELKPTNRNQNLCETIFFSHRKNSKNRWSCRPASKWSLVDKRRIHFHKIQIQGFEKRY